MFNNKADFLFISQIVKTFLYQFNLQNAASWVSCSAHLLRSILIHMPQLPSYINFYLTVICLSLPETDVMWTGCAPTCWSGLRCRHSSNSTTRQVWCGARVWVHKRGATYGFKRLFLPLLVQYCAVLCYTHHLLIPEPESLLLLVLYNVSCVFIWFLFARLDRFISAQNNFYHF